MKTENLKWTEQTLYVALLLTNERSFVEHMSGLDKTTPEGKLRAEEYNAALRMLQSATEHCGKVTRSRQVLAYRPTKANKFRNAGEVNDGTPLDLAMRRVVTFRTELVLTADRTGILTEESGVPLRAFGRIAVEQGIIPRDFARYTESGNRSYPWEAVKEWLQWRDVQILNARSEAAKETATEHTQALAIAAALLSGDTLSGLTEKQTLREVNKAIRLNLSFTVKEAETIAKEAYYKARAVAA